jgi:hypothetical protein
MLIALDRSIIARAAELRAVYAGNVITDNPALTPVLNEFKKLALQLSPSMGRFVFRTTKSDTVTRNGGDLSGDLRILVHLRDQLRATGIAADTVTLLSTSIKNIAFRLSKAALHDRSVADLYDVSGWSDHL